MANSGITPVMVIMMMYSTFIYSIDLETSFLTYWRPRSRALLLLFRFLPINSRDTRQERLEKGLYAKGIFTVATLPG